jgi:glycerol-3-phosphate cytidylyltransferase
MIDQERINAYVAKLQAAGHTLRMTESLRVDLDAWDHDYHSGPVCETCGGAWCIYCESTVEPCRPFRLGILASAFDPFPHPGHLWAIQQALAADACDAILAALHEDPTVERPAKRKPTLTVEERTELLLACRHVHAVVTYRTEADLLEIMRNRRPAVRILGEDHRHDHNTGDDLDPPIPVFWAKRKPEWSGTQMARRIAESLPDVAASLRFTDGLNPTVMARWTAQELQAIHAVFETLGDAFDRHLADRAARGCKPGEM